MLHPFSLLFLGDLIFCKELGTISYNLFIALGGFEISIYSSVVLIFDLFPAKMLRRYRSVAMQLGMCCHGQTN
jgi:hypothetical protein